MADNDADPPPPFDSTLDETDDTFLPPFANALNRNLNEEIKGTQKQVNSTDAELEDNHDRIGVMENMLRLVRQELEHTQRRLENKNRELAYEKHLDQLAARETGRTRREFGKLEKEQEELAEKMNSLQTQLFRGNERMDQFKLLMHWNQEELEQWAYAQRQKEEDNLAMQKYSRADEARVSELSLHVQKVSKEVAEKKRELDEEVTETQSAQLQLDKAAEDFKKLHHERQDLVTQWDEAATSMRRRDEAIQVATERYAERKAALRELQELLDQKNTFMEEEKLNNKELDARIAQTEREIQKAKTEQLRFAATVAEMHEEVQVIRNTLQKAVSTLADSKGANTRARETLADKRVKMEQMEGKLSDAQTKLEVEMSELDSLEKRNDMLDSIYKEKEEELRRMRGELALFKQNLFKKSQDLFKLRSMERDKIAEIAGGQAQDRNLSAKINQLDTSVVKQQELLYAAEFQAQQLERKVARASGERSDDEKRALDAKIAVLTEQLEVASKSLNQLVAQVKRAQDDLQAARRQHVDADAQMTELSAKIAELKLESDAAALALKDATASKEEKMVSHDVLRLEMRRLKDILALRVDEVMGLENRRYQLTVSMEERKQEVEVHHAALKAQFKALHDDVHRLNLELREREMRAQALEAKYGVVSSKSFKEDGEEKSQAYFLIKAAMEREELQREGNELDEQIQRAEKEVRALEATLGKLTDKNNMFRDTGKVVKDANQLQEKADLRAKLDKTYDRMKQKREEEKALRGDLEAMQGREAALSAEELALTDSVEDLRKRREDLERGLVEQEEKRQRAERRAARLREDARVSAGIPLGGDVLPFEKEVELAEAKESHRDLLNQLAAAIAANPGLGLESRAAEVSIRLPNASRGGSRVASGGGVTFS